MKSKIIAVDLGNFNVKNSDNIVFQTRFKEGTLDGLHDGNVITYGGINYVMESGSWEHEGNKAVKNYMPNLLYSLSKSVGLNVTEASFDVALGLPILQMPQKEKIKEKLENKTFEFSLNGKAKKFNINKVAIIAEGFSSLYVLGDNERSRDILMIDIGGKTVNVVEYSNKRVGKTDTLYFGAFRLYSLIKDRLAGEGKSINLDEIERLVKGNWIKDIQSEKEQFIDEVLNQLKENFDINTYNVYFTGGGSILLSDVINSKINNLNVVPNPLFSNCIGNYNIAKAKWEE